MKKYKVEFSGGQSRTGANSVNYMLVEVEDTELYAECDITDAEEENDFFGFDELKDSIIEQAEENGINIEALEFDI